MTHGLCKARLEAYAEGRLHRPFTWLVELHTRGCHECRQELKRELALVRELDRLLFQSDEVVRTVARVTQREVQGVERKSVRRSGYRMMLAGAAALLVLLAIIPGSFGGWFSPGPIVVSASTWSEGYATSVQVADVGLAGEGVPVTNTSDMSKGYGTAFPVHEERGG